MDASRHLQGLVFAFAIVGLGCATSVSGAGPSDCTSLLTVGQQTVGAGHTGALGFSAPIKSHHIKIVAPASNSTSMDFWWPGSSVVGCLNNSFPDRMFNPSNTQMYVFARTVCGDGKSMEEDEQVAKTRGVVQIRGCPTVYGWYFEADSATNGQYTMHAIFEN